MLSSFVSFQRLSVSVDRADSAFNRHISAWNKHMRPFHRASAGIGAGDVLWRSLMLRVGSECGRAGLQFVLTLFYGSLY